MIENQPQQQLRLRVFAGPNGSGKSTIIKAVRDARPNGTPIGFGTYINADELAFMLKEGGIPLDQFGLQLTIDQILNILESSGLLNEQLSTDTLKGFLQVNSSAIVLHKPEWVEPVAQMIAYIFREILLSQHQRFSFETVFSHPSKLDIMRRAKEAGYKVYLYYVATEDPEINKFRVKHIRVPMGGHDVPAEKIESRYFRSLDLLYDAAQLAYQAYFFDNSDDGGSHRLFAHFKVTGDQKNWTTPDNSRIPVWFQKYYFKKVAEKLNPLGG
ncbi:MAG: hypothetical protein AAFQ98_09100 [Bacteroidota bacterium]